MEVDGSDRQKVTDDRSDRLTGQFETLRPTLRALAYRMLGSAAEADDAVQEGWIRLGRVDADDIEHLEAWLRTAVTRICLDVLRSRSARREELADQATLDRLTSLDATGSPDAHGAPDDDTVLADSVGRALLVVLDRLSPPERVAFVLHDLYAVPFDEIAPIVERTPTTTKKLASRARRKVRGIPAVPTDVLARRRDIIAAFLAAMRAGDLATLLRLLAPDVVRTADPAALPAGAPREVRGAREVAEGTVALAHRAAHADLALVDGSVGLVVAPRGRLALAVRFAFVGELIAAYDVVADADRLDGVDLAVVD